MFTSGGCTSQSLLVDIPSKVDDSLFSFEVTSFIPRSLSALSLPAMRERGEVPDDFGVSVALTIFPQSSPSIVKRKIAANIVRKVLISSNVIFSLKNNVSRTAFKTIATVLINVRVMLPKRLRITLMLSP